MSGPPQRTDGGLPALLPAIATAAFAAGLAVILLSAAASVNGARERATKNVARMAANLWEIPGSGADAVAQLLGERATIEAAAADGGAARTRTEPGAFGYRPGALDPSVWIAVAPEPDHAPPPRPTTPLALLGLLLMIAWAARRRRRPPPPRYPAATLLLAAAFLALVALLAARRAHHELEDISAAHLTHATRTAEIAVTSGADPAQAARAAGLPWATTAALADPTQLWTMPRAVSEAIAALPPPLRTAPTYTLRAAGATYHVAQTTLRPNTTTPTQSPTDPAPSPDDPSPAASPTTLHLALLGYEETASPTVPLTAAAAGSTLLVAIILFLLPLSARPRALRRTLAAWGFLAPAATLLLVFTFGPLLFSLWISLHEWHLVDPAHPFAGLDNYRHILLDTAWWSSIRNTTVFTLHVPLAMAVALALALLTQGSRRAVRWARLALFLPSITSVVAIAVVWKWLLNDGYGLVNQLLARAGFGPVPWLTSPDTALASLMLISVWMVVGYQMVVFQAGLAAIPRDWYDAARVDGAGPLQRFRHITLPGLRHTLFFVLVTSVIGSFQVFGLVYVMTEGGPLGATDVAVYHIYREAWEFLRFGNAAAMSWVLFAVVFAATWLHFRFLEGRRAHA